MRNVDPARGGSPARLVGDHDEVARRADAPRARARGQSFDVRFSFQGVAVGRMRNEVRVTAEAPPSGGVYDIATDEGEAHDGEATAPTPLHYFTAALAGCFMTQVRAFARRMDVRLDGLTVDDRTAWRGHPLPSSAYETEPVGFRLDVRIASPAATAEVVALIRAAARGCFVEQSLAPGVPVHHRLHHAGRAVDVDVRDVVPDEGHIRPSPAAGSR